MVMLTDLLRFAVRDRLGRSAPVVDLCVTLLGDDYPPVTFLLVRHERELRHLEWGEVTSIAVKKRTINVDDLGKAEAVEDDTDVRLRRDILDALVLDLEGRRTTRVGDLQLAENDGQLRITGADAGIASMLRRVTRGRLGRVNREAIFDWKNVEFLRGDPAAVDNGAGYRLRINRLPAGEIARLADFIPYLHAAELIKLLPDDKAADVLEAMSIERQLQVIEELPEDEAIELISLMSPDLATDLVGRLELAVMKRYVTRMPPLVRDRILALLKFPENTVGGVMINDMISISLETEPGQLETDVLDRLKGTDFTSDIFIIDNERDRKLCGVISLRDLLTKDEGKSLEDAMDPYVDALGPFQPAISAAHRIVESGLAAMPVIEHGGRLIGAMTVDAAITQLVTSTSELQTLRIFS